MSASIFQRSAASSKGALDAEFVNLEVAAVSDADLSKITTPIMAINIAQAKYKILREVII
jgi:hypothetical protein